MTYTDLIMTNMVFNALDKINTGYFILDLIYTFLIATLLFSIFTRGLKNKVLNWLVSLKNKFIKTNIITFKTVEELSNDSLRLRAIMNYISQNADASVRQLIEVPRTKFSRTSEEFEEVKGVNYRVTQSTIFNIDKKNHILGRIYLSEKSKLVRDKTEMIEYFNLDIMSNKLSLLQLQNWVEEREKEYQTYLRNKSIDKQLLVEINWNIKDRDIDINYVNWSSNVTFSNRFFSNKDEIVSKIDWFLSNEKWYKERGIPYTLGFLLWGEPGCGKTGFIKALMNKTGRHGINIKLNKKFDMNVLKDLICDDEIGDELIIEQKNRILIFEDIDCMSDIVKERTLESSDTLVLTEKVMGKKVVLEKQDELSNNNLSYFLNILDGLHECPGRIIIMTTNRPEYLDKALIRPGRIDYKINFTKATITDINNILKFYWSIDEDITFNDELELKYSHAEIINICRTSCSYKETIQKLITTNILD